MRKSLKLSLSVSFRPSAMLFSLRVFYFLVENMFRLVPHLPATRQVNLTGRRISCKKRESRRLLSFAVSLIRMLDGAVRRTTGGVPPPRWRGAQRPSNIRLTCICAFADAKRKAKLARKLHKKGSCVSSDHPKQLS